MNLGQKVSTGCLVRHETCFPPRQKGSSGGLGSPAVDGSLLHSSGHWPPPPSLLCCLAQNSRKGAPEKGGGVEQMAPGVRRSFLSELSLYIFSNTSWAKIASEPKVAAREPGNYVFILHGPDQHT